MYSPETFYIVIISIPKP